jgi:hypothetical protein
MKAWNKASTAVWGIDALSRELSKDCGRKKILICPTNFTEGGNVHSVEEELQFHEACLAPHLDKSCTIFIKGHPRETMSQAARLTARLSSKGHDARCFPAFNTLPVDLFARCLRIDLLMSLYSHSGVVWPLLQPETDVLYGVSPDLVRKFIRPEAVQMFRYEEITALYYLLGIMASRREYTPVRMQSVRKSLGLVPKAPILLPGRPSEAQASPRLDPAAEKFYKMALTC